MSKKAKRVYLLGVLSFNPKRIMRGPRGPAKLQWMILQLLWNYHDMWSALPIFYTRWKHFWGSHGPRICFSVSIFCIILLGLIKSILYWKKNFKISLDTMQFVNTEESNQTLEQKQKTNMSFLCEMGSIVNTLSLARSIKNLIPTGLTGQKNII